MKYLIIPILVITALLINIRISNDIKWQKSANYRWDRDLSNQRYSRWDNYSEPKIGEQIKKTHQLCMYVFKMDEYNRKNKCN